jgi:hypothetical protein
VTVTLDELLADAQVSSEAKIVAECDVRIGGVDPLGLRQTNFDMMDQVLPGLNNVARHVRPFILMTWAWRRCNRLVREKGAASVKEMRNFVDRIETIYAWSQFLIDPATDLPGSQALAPLLSAQSYTFAGRAWETFRDTRRVSTGLIAAVNYGPGLRTMRWIADLSTLPGSGIVEAGAYKANPADDPMLDEALGAFEAKLGDHLDHPAFSDFGKVTVEIDEVRQWGALWKSGELNEVAQEAAWRRVTAGEGHVARSKGLQLIQFAADQLSAEVMSTNEVRRLMANGAGLEFPDELAPFARRWRRMQIRQVFRLALEGLLYWCQGELSNGPATTRQLAARLLDQAGAAGEHARAEEWLVEFSFGTDPVEHLDGLSASLRRTDTFAKTFVAALRFCMAEAPEEPQPFERSDRLPLARAARIWRDWCSAPPIGLLSNVIEGWIFAQHTYWSVGRGLQDARGDGKMILRLRLFIDEGGWRLSQGLGQGAPPNATPDRLETALRLLQECDRL